MLSENIKAVRRSKGLSQEGLAIKLNVVRQTISKWEQGISVPDADMLVSLAQTLETPVSTLLGETVAEEKTDDLKTISEKLEVINLQLARRKAIRQRVLHWTFILLCAIIVAVYAALIAWGSEYLSWDYSHPETAVAGTVIHAFEWVFVRIAPIALAGSIAGACLTRKKK